MKTTIIILLATLFLVSCEPVRPYTLFLRAGNAYSTSVTCDSFTMINEYEAIAYSNGSKMHLKSIGAILPSSNK